MKRKGAVRNRLAGATATKVSMAHVVKSNTSVGLIMQTCALDTDENWEGFYLSQRHLERLTKRS